MPLFHDIAGSEWGTKMFLAVVSIDRRRRLQDSGWKPWPLAKERCRRMLDIFGDGSLACRPAVPSLPIGPLPYEIPATYIPCNNQPQTATNETQHHASPTHTAPPKSRLYFGQLIRCKMLLFNFLSTQTSHLQEKFSSHLSTYHHIVSCPSPGFLGRANSRKEPSDQLSESRIGVLPRVPTSPLSPRAQLIASGGTSTPQNGDIDLQSFQATAAAEGAAAAEAPHRSRKSLVGGR
jgi:hypothetical protein